MAPKLLKDIKYPDYPKMIEVRVVNKWYTRGNILQFSYLFVDITGYGVETLAPLTDEIDLERMITLQQCYRITNYTTVKARTYSPVVPHPISILIGKHTHFQPVVNESIPLYYFNFVTLDELEDRLPRGSPLSDYVGRAESVTEMMPITEKKTGNTIYLRRVVIMDDRSRPIEVTLWEDKGRAVDKAAALHQIVAVTATYAKKFLRDIQLTSTSATMFFVDPPTPDLQQLKQRFSDLPHIGTTIPRSTPSSDMPKFFISDLHMKSKPEFNRIQFSCEATITEIFGPRSWFYLACQHCSRKVNQEMNKEGDILWRCLTHETMTNPTQLYILNIVITDDTGSTEAIFFNSAIEQLTGISCQQLIATKDHVDPKVPPDEIKNLCGQRNRLQVTIKHDGSVNVNKVLEQQVPLPLPTPTAETSSVQHPPTPAPKQKKLLAESSSASTASTLTNTLVISPPHKLTNVIHTILSELPPPPKKSKLSSETTQD